MRSLYVYPARAMWPSMLPTVAVNRALMAPEKHENINGWKISRYRFFFIVFLISFLYFWFPNYIFQALSYFSWMTWIKPDNLKLDVLTGSQSGLGLNPITSFDFNVMFFNSPLAIPIFTSLLQYLGSIISFFIVLGMWFSNYKWTGYLPINSYSLFDNTGATYNISKVLDGKGTFDSAKFKEYSPTFYSAGLLMNYGATFVAVPFVVVYVILTQYKPIYRGLKVIRKVLTERKGSSFSNFNDPFCRMNSAYKEAPEWWFLVILVISIVLAIVCVEIYPTETPVWSIFFSLAFNVVFLIPFLQVYSSTGAYISLTVVLELISGYAIRGNGVALMIAALFGYSIDEQCQNYLTNQKIAHYAKIPPRAMFRGQLLTTMINLVVTIAIINWQVDFPEICTSDQKNNFTCPVAQSQYNAAISWGVIGPYRVIEHLYPILKWSFLIGFLLAFPAVLFRRYGPKKITKYFEPNVIISGMAIWAPYNLSYYTPGIYWAIGFMYYLKNYYTSWWNKYNYIFYSGIQAGIAFSAVIIFFAVQYHDKYISWWGNNVILEGLDGEGGGPLFYPTKEMDNYFGPRIGEFS
ncbi:uncharacterized protein PRCAT00001385001 [Priceomyces carsonii]|uniref:uncharacterized protein n=1 Tax=Priceomyces carsonii TaxID=28549 RepID=UPI002ED894CB|nr:unnamed protein product [Priceomyces carsonii]